MRKRSVVLLIAMVLSVPSCSLFKSPPPPVPPPPQFAQRTATLNITAGIKVLSSIDLPDGFVPRTGARPMWLAQGTAVAVVGSLGRKSVVLDFSGAKLANRTVLASDFGPGAPDGRILEVAASPDGMELAIAVAPPDASQLEVRIVDTLSGGDGYSVASFDGQERLVSLDWLNRTTVAAVLQAPPQPVSEAADGLYLIDIAGVGSITRLARIQCPLGPVSFSPNRRLAVTTGDRTHPAVMADLRTQRCASFRPAGPVGILGWAPDSSAFLYVAREGPGLAVFRHTVATGQRTLIAVSSGAAAYASDGMIVALGNGQLSFRDVARDPTAPIKAEIALLDPRTAVVTLNSLGFDASPEMMARSTMAMTTATDSAAIDALVPVAGEVYRELIDYSYPARSAFVLASGRAAGVAAMSWSPNGRALAIVDGDGRRFTLTVLMPPR